MYRTILSPAPIRTSRISAPFSRLVQIDNDPYGTAREFLGGDTYRASTLLSNPPQLVDPELRDGSEIFPRMTLGREGVNAISSDPAYRKAYITGEMFRPKPVKVNSPNVAFRKAGQSPGQARELENLINQNPSIASSFDIGIGSSLNREQLELQEKGLPYEFDPSDEKWRSGFSRKRNDIIPMSQLQWALRNNSQGILQEIDPSTTKLQYTMQPGDINDPQRFFNLASRGSVNYDGIIEALDTLPPKNPTLKKGQKDYSLGNRYNRVKGYSPLPDNRVTWVQDPLKPRQTIDEIIDDVNQVEPWRTPRMADSRISRSGNMGSADLNIIPRDYTRKEYLEATGDSDNLPPLDYSPNNTLVELFGGIAADRDGNTFPLTRLKRKESSVIGREFDESNAKSAFTFPVETRRAYKLLRDGNPVIEDRTFLLSEPQPQRTSTRLGTQYTTPFVNPYRQALPQGETELANGMVVNQYAPVKAPELAREAWAEESALSPNTSTRVRGLEPYYRIAGQKYMVGEKEGLAKPFYTPEVILPESLSRKTPMYFEGIGGISPNNYRVAGSTSKLGGYNEFNEVMDEGIQASRDLDRLYPLNDELAYLGDIAKGDDMYADILGYEQSEVLDKIVDAERAAERMGGTYRRLSGKGEQGVAETLGLYNEPAPSQLIQYNINEVLEPSFGSDYSGRTNTGRVRTSVGTDYDAGIPVGAVVKTRIANPIIDPIKLDDPTVEPFNVAQYNRDLIDRGRVGLNHVHGTSELMGNILIDTQLGIPIVKAPTTSFNPKTQRNESYLQPVRPSRVVDTLLPWGPIDNTANWQAPESLAIGRVGKSIAVRGIPELPVNTGVRMSSPIPLGDIYGPPTPMRRAILPSRDWATTTQGQILYPNAGIGPINTGLKPKPTIGELFGFTALTPEGLAKYRDMG